MTARKAEGNQAGGKTERVTVTLPREVANELTAESADRDTTVSAVVREAVAEYFVRRRTAALPDFVGMAEYPDDDLSERVEEIIARDHSGE